MVEEKGIRLSEALNQYLAILKSGGQKGDGHQELARFVRWCGRDRSPSELSPPEIGEYAESAGVWGGDSAQKLKPVKSFLAYLGKAGMTRTGLATHLKPTRAKKGPQQVYSRANMEHAELSQEGFTNLQTRLEVLKEERMKVVGDIQRAMADKDFRENAPLDAAKERQGLIESSIRELENILANAVVSSPDADDNGKRIKLGKKVTIQEVGNSKEISYILVDPREADPNSGKLSSASPVGRGLMDKLVGDEVHVATPRGATRYVVLKIEA
ncbi:MAG: transcription elongation factor GreA [Dehalococcoidia bacterium]|nr:transcription elongation factor GreA [Dehalococcoidia bacterium]